MLRLYFLLCLGYWFGAVINDGLKSPRRVAFANLFNLAVVILTIWATAVLIIRGWHQ